MSVKKQTFHPITHVPSATSATPAVRHAPSPVAVTDLGDPYATRRLRDARRILSQSVSGSGGMGDAWSRFKEWGRDHGSDMYAGRTVADIIAGGDRVFSAVGSRRRADWRPDAHDGLASDVTVGYAMSSPDDGRTLHNYIVLADAQGRDTALEITSDGSPVALDRGALDNLKKDMSAAYVPPARMAALARRAHVDIGAVVLAHYARNLRSMRPAAEASAMASLMDADEMVAAADTFGRGVLGLDRPASYADLAAAKSSAIDTWYAAHRTDRGAARTARRMRVAVAAAHIRRVADRSGSDPAAWRAAMSRATSGSDSIAGDIDVLSDWLSTAVTYGLDHWSVAGADGRVLDMGYESLDAIAGACEDALVRDRASRFPAAGDMGDDALRTAFRGRYVMRDVGLVRDRDGDGMHLHVSYAFAPTFEYAQGLARGLDPAAGPRDRAPLDVDIPVPEGVHWVGDPGSFAPGATYADLVSLVVSRSGVAWDEVLGSMLPDVGDLGRMVISRNPVRVGEPDAPSQAAVRAALPHYDRSLGHVLMTWMHAPAMTLRPDDGNSAEGLPGAVDERVVSGARHGLFDASDTPSCDAVTLYVDQQGSNRQWLESLNSLTDTASHRFSPASLARAVIIMDGLDERGVQLHPGSTHVRDDFMRGGVGTLSMEQTVTLPSGAVRTIRLMEGGADDRGRAEADGWHPGYETNQGAQNHRTPWYDASEDGVMRTFDVAFGDLPAAEGDAKNRVWRVKDAVHSWGQYRHTRSDAMSQGVVGGEGAAAYALFGRSYEPYASTLSEADRAAFDAALSAMGAASSRGSAPAPAAFRQADASRAMRALWTASGDDAARAGLPAPVRAWLDWSPDGDGTLAESLKGIYDMRVNASRWIHDTTVSAVASLAGHVLVGSPLDGRDDGMGGVTLDAGPAAEGPSALYASWHAAFDDASAASGGPAPVAVVDVVGLAPQPLSKDATDDDFAGAWDAGADARADAVVRAEARILLDGVDLPAGLDEDHALAVMERVLKARRDGETDEAGRRRSVASLVEESLEHSDPDAVHMVAGLLPRAAEARRMAAPAVDMWYALALRGDADAVAHASALNAARVAMRPSTSLLAPRIAAGILDAPADGDRAAWSRLAAALADGDASRFDAEAGPRVTRECLRRVGRWDVSAVPGAVHSINPSLVSEWSAVPSPFDADVRGGHIGVLEGYIARATGTWPENAGVEAALYDFVRLFDGPRPYAAGDDGTVSLDWTGSDQRSPILPLDPYAPGRGDARAGQDDDFDGSDEVTGAEDDQDVRPDPGVYALGLVACSQHMRRGTSGWHYVVPGDGSRPHLERRRFDGGDLTPDDERGQADVPAGWLALAGQAYQTLERSNMSGIDIAIDDDGVLYWSARPVMAGTDGALAPAAHVMHGRLGPLGVIDRADAQAGAPVVRTMLASGAASYVASSRLVVAPASSPAPGADPTRPDLGTVAERARIQSWLDVMRSAVTGAVLSQLRVGFPDERDVWVGSPDLLASAHRSFIDGRKTDARRLAAAYGPEIDHELGGVDTADARRRAEAIAQYTVDARFNHQAGQLAMHPGVADGGDVGNVYALSAYANGDAGPLMLSQATWLSDVPVVDAADTSNGAKQGLSAILTAPMPVDWDAVVDADTDGLIPAGTSMADVESGSSWSVDRHSPESRYVIDRGGTSCDTPDRRRMTDAAISQGNGVARAHVARMGMAGLTNEDAIVVSRAYAERMQVTPSAKGASRSLIVGDKMGDAHGDKGVISAIVDTSPDATGQAFVHTAVPVPVPGGGESAELPVRAMRVDGAEGPYVVVASADGSAMLRPVERDEGSGSWTFASDGEPQDAQGAVFTGYVYDGGTLERAVDEATSRLEHLGADDPVRPAVARDIARCIALMNAARAMRDADADVVMSPYAAVSRFTAGTLQEVVEGEPARRRARADAARALAGAAQAFATLTDGPEAARAHAVANARDVAANAIDADGGGIVDGVAEPYQGVTADVLTVVYPQSADIKAKVYPDGPGQGRQASFQMLWGLSSVPGAGKVIDWLYRNNTGAVSSLRAACAMCGTAWDGHGALRPLDRVPEDWPRVDIAENALSGDGGIGQRAVAKYSSPRVATGESLAVSRADMDELRRRARAALLDADGDPVVVPLTVFDGVDPDRMPADLSGLPRDDKGRPCLVVGDISRLGLGSEDCVKMSERARLLVDATAACMLRDAVVARAEGGDGDARRVIDSASGTLADALDRFVRSKAGGFVSASLDDAFVGKHNDVKEGVMRAPVGRSATVPWTPDDYLGLDDVGVPRTLAHSLGVEDGSHVLVWRDPILDSDGCRAMTVRLIDDPTAADGSRLTYSDGSPVTGSHIAVNSKVDTLFKGDHDGDTVALVPRPAGSDVEKAALSCLRPSMAALDIHIGPDETGRYGVELDDDFDNATARSMDPALAKAHDGLRTGLNALFDDPDVVREAKELGVDDEAWRDCRFMLPVFRSKSSAMACAWADREAMALPGTVGHAAVRTGGDPAADGDWDYVSTGLKSIADACLGTLAKPKPAGLVAYADRLAAGFADAQADVVDQYVRAHMACEELVDRLVQVGRLGDNVHAPDSEADEVLSHRADGTMTLTLPRPVDAVSPDTPLRGPVVLTFGADERLESVAVGGQDTPVDGLDAEGRRRLLCDAYDALDRDFVEGLNRRTGIDLTALGADGYVRGLRPGAGPVARDTDGRERMARDVIHDIVWAASPDAARVESTAQTALRDWATDKEADESVSEAVRKVASKLAKAVEETPVSRWDINTDAEVNLATATKSGLTGAAGSVQQAAAATAATVVGAVRRDARHNGASGRTVDFLSAAAMRSAMDTVQHTEQAVLQVKHSASQAQRMITTLTANHNAGSGVYKAVLMGGAMSYTLARGGADPLMDDGTGPGAGMYAVGSAGDMKKMTSADRVGRFERVIELADVASTANPAANMRYMDLVGRAPDLLDAPGRRHRGKDKDREVYPNVAQALAYRVAQKMARSGTSAADIVGWMKDNAAAGAVLFDGDDPTIPDVKGVLACGVGAGPSAPAPVPEAAPQADTAHAPARRRVADVVRGVGDVDEAVRGAVASVPASRTTTGASARSITAPVVRPDAVASRLPSQTVVLESDYPVAMEQDREPDDDREL